ncbi:hypothetical protein EV401DRAFT_1895551 [Pisolithus croceorrhizus]|nr:hypothetical protein EV401DRAFT_1895551 [Pisolithus croceorrhizus]
MLAHVSAPFLSTFLVIHLPASIAVNIGGSRLASSVMWVDLVCTGGCATSRKGVLLDYVWGTIPASLALYYPRYVERDQGWMPYTGLVGSVLVYQADHLRAAVMADSLEATDRLLSLLVLIDFWVLPSELAFALSSPVYSEELYDLELFSFEFLVAPMIPVAADGHVVTRCLLEKKPNWFGGLVSTYTGDLVIEPVLLFGDINDNGQTSASVRYMCRMEKSNRPERLEGLTNLNQWKLI